MLSSSVSYVTPKTLDGSTWRTARMTWDNTRRGMGFFIKHLHINPTDGSTNGYIPFPPYYIDEETLRELLTPYGTIVTGGFVETKLHTRIAGYKFSIEFHKETSPPTSITYNGCTMDIKYDDDLRQCKYCGRYGHLIGKCRTKAADDATNKHRRDEIRTNTWKEDRQNLTDESLREREKLGAQYDEEITALSDVHEAALIPIEETADNTERLQHLEAAYHTELDKHHDHYVDSLSFLDDDISDRKSTLDTGPVESFHQVSRHQTPDRIPNPKLTRWRRKAIMTWLPEPKTVSHLHSRISVRIRTHHQCLRLQFKSIAPRPHTSPVTPQDAAIVPVRSAEDRHPPRLQGTKQTRDTTTSKTTSKLTNFTPFYSLTPAAQDSLTTQATQRLPSAFNYRTYSTHQIQLKTNTPHLTQLLHWDVMLCNSCIRKRGYH